MTENTYGREVNACVDKVGRVSVTAGAAHRHELQRLTDCYHRVLSWSSVSDMLTDIWHRLIKQFDRLVYLT